VSDLASDPRWRRFNDAGFRCGCCGQSFGGVFDISFDHPDMWPHGNREASGETSLTVGEDRLTSDLCRLGDDHFVRCVLPIPIRGSDEVFSFGVWGSVATENFDRYVKGWQAEDYGDFDGCFSWLTNALPGIPTSESVPCDLVIGELTQRPKLFAHEDAGAVRDAQSQGITFDDLLDIYAASGQDIRPHLMDA
jgi:hypothetical protein